MRIENAESGVYVAPFFILHSAFCILNFLESCYQQCEFNIAVLGLLGHVGGLAMILWRQNPFHHKAIFVDALAHQIIHDRLRAATGSGFDLGLGKGAFGAKTVLVGGGVSANKVLRERMQRRLTVPVSFPPLALCTDNAAMIGAAAHFAFVRGLRDTLEMDVAPDLKLGN